MLSPYNRHWSHSILILPILTSCQHTLDIQLASKIFDRIYIQLVNKIFSVALSIKSFCVYYVRVLFPVHSPLLIKTPQALLKEVSSYEASIQSVERKAQELVDSDHFAAEDISQQMASLQRQWKELKLVSGRRTQKLSDALEAQNVRHYSVYLNHNLLSFPGSSW